jgi:predicted NBD/HSP70 family sugar kinase
VPETVVAGLDVGGTKTLGVAVVVDHPASAGPPAELGRGLANDDLPAPTPAPQLADGADGGGIWSAGDVVATVRRPTAAGNGDRLLRSTGAVLGELAAAAGVPVDGFGAVGVGVPGLVDRSAGTVRHAVNLGLGDTPIPLAGHLGAIAQAPVVVDNDVNMAALGAAVALGCHGDLAYLSVGTGLAAGLLLGGHIRRGAHGAAGEIGHLPVDPQGPRCECGQRGCLEALVSGAAIAARWPSADGAAAATAALLAAASAGDERALAVLSEVAGHLATAVALLAQTVDPELIVLGGGVAEPGPGLLDAVRDALRDRAARSPVLAAIALADRVTLVPEGVPAGAVGAAVLARHHLARAVGGRAHSARTTGLAGAGDAGSGDGSGAGAPAPNDR